MKKIDIGEVKTTERVRNGVKQVIKLFTPEQRELIRRAVESKPDEMTIEQVLDLYEVSAPVYYTWLRNDKAKKDSFIPIPNPLLDLSINSDLVHPSYHLREFFFKYEEEIVSYIEKKFEEWKSTDLIIQLCEKITNENADEVAKAGKISVDDLKSFLMRQKLDISYFTVESIKNYLSLNVK